MFYISTRDYNLSKKNKKSFCEILLSGLADDGGLYLPEYYPQVDLQNLRDIYNNQGYVDLAFNIFSLFINDIPNKDLYRLCLKTYNKEIFNSDKIVPIENLKELNKNLYLAGLSNGPTLAFKDVAMQLLGNLFEYELKRQNKTLNILGATSGDTGSAAEYAMKNKENINVFMTSPFGRMSDFQQAQMFSLKDKNIHNLSIKGVFDDCQDIVKKISNDLEFKTKYNIGTVNSINWARILAQIVYYFSSYFQITDNNKEEINFAVPSGNFGNICAGHIAKQIGLKIKNLILATNENDVLNVFFKTGVYSPRLGKDTFETSSPSMDISKASNFERFIFDLLNKDSEKLNKLFIEDLNNQGYFDLSDELENIKNKFGFISGKSTHLDRLNTIKKVYDNCNKIIDPHTADALKTALDFLDKNTKTVVLETALPMKFEKTIYESLGFKIKRQEKFKDIERLEKKYQVLDNDIEQVKEYIIKNV